MPGVIVGRIHAWYCRLSAIISIHCSRQAACGRERGLPFWFGHCNTIHMLRTKHTGAIFRRLLLWARTIALTAPPPPSLSPFVSLWWQTTYQGFAVHIHVIDVSEIEYLGAALVELVSRFRIHMHPRSFRQLPENSTGFWSSTLCFCRSSRLPHSGMPATVGTNTRFSRDLWFLGEGA